MDYLGNDNSPVKGFSIFECSSAYDLTPSEAKRYLENIVIAPKSHDIGEKKMPVTIRTKQTCPKCENPFEHLAKQGFICLRHKTTPDRFFIDVHFKGRIKVYSHKNGMILSSYELATEAADAIKSEIRAHTFDPSRYIKAEQARFLFEKVAEAWLDDKKRDVKAGMRAQSYYIMLEQYNNTHYSFFKGKDIRELRRYDIDEFRKSLPDHLKPKTIKNILISLKNLFNEAYKKELIEKIPSFPSIFVPEYSGWKWIDSETQINILQKIADIDRPIFAFLFLHGIRTGEARALKVKDIERGSSSIRIRRTWSIGELKETTKQKRQNIIPIHPEMLPYIEDVCKSSLPEAFLFTNKRTGRPYSDDSLRKSWIRALTACKIEHIKLYDATRHSFASQLVNHSVPLSIISRLLGHSSLKMTQRYAHENILTLKSAVEQISLTKAPSDVYVLHRK